MVNDAPERWEAVDESLVPENMIDTKAIHGRAPSPFLLVAIPCTPQIDEASLPAKGFKEIDTIEARSGVLDIEIISARVEVTDHDKRHIGILLCHLDALLKEGCLGLPLWEIASQDLDTLYKIDQDEVACRRGRGRNLPRLGGIYRG